VFKHDKQPIDGCVYVHKAKAAKRLKGLQTPDYYELTQVCIASKEVMERIVDRLSELEKANHAR
jgi:hypothetical protein